MVCGPACGDRGRIYCTIFLSPALFQVGRDGSQEHFRRVKNMSDEKMILTHEPVPGYRKIFHVVVLVAVAYLSIIFIMSFF